MKPVAKLKPKVLTIVLTSSLILGLGIAILLIALLSPQPFQILAVATNPAEQKAINLAISVWQSQNPEENKIDLTIVDGESPIPENLWREADLVFYIAGNSDILKSSRFAPLNRDLVTRFPSNLTRWGPSSHELLALPILADTTVLFAQNSVITSLKLLGPINLTDLEKLPFSTNPSLFQILLPGADYRMVADLAFTRLGESQSKDFLRLQDQAITLEPDALVQLSLTKLSLFDCASAFAMWQKSQLAAPGWLDIEAGKVDNWVSQFKPIFFISTLGNRLADNKQSYASYLTLPINNAPIRVLSAATFKDSPYLEQGLKFLELITSPDLQSRMSSDAGLIPAALSASSSDTQTTTIRQWVASLQSPVPTISAGIYPDYRQNRILCQEIQAAIRRESLK